MSTLQINLSEVQSLPVHQNKSYLIAKHLERAIINHLNNEGVVELPSIKTMSDAFNCSHIDIVHALGEIRSKGYDYCLSDSGSPVTVRYR